MVGCTIFKKFPFFDKYIEKILNFFFFQVWIWIFFSTVGSNFAKILIPKKWKKEPDLVGEGNPEGNQRHTKGGRKHHLIVSLPGSKIFLWSQTVLRPSLKSALMLYKWEGSHFGLSFFNLISLESLKSCISFESVKCFEFLKGFLGVSFQFLLWRFISLAIYRVDFITSWAPLVSTRSCLKKLWQMIQLQCNCLFQNLGIFNINKAWEKKWTIGKRTIGQPWLWCETS
jgi:hypothetical protein